MLRLVVTPLLLGALLMSGAHCVPMSNVNMANARKFGRGQNGARSIRILLTSNETRQTKQEALSSLTQYGEDAAPVILEFEKQVQSDPSWDLALIEAMRKVIDRRFLPSLERAVLQNPNVRVRCLALETLQMYVRLQAVWFLAAENPSISIRSPIRAYSDDPLQSFGIDITLEDRKMINSIAERIISNPNSPSLVKDTAAQVLDLLVKKEAAEKAAVEGAKTRASK